ncbi:hypothetical protein, partial [Klebsiella pneumoniae]|uniref:hypothetical protein n=1 Tax=Klebsiella pneumoniae TaxID=573 RepID=UPI003013EE0D
IFFPLDPSPAAAAAAAASTSSCEGDHGFSRTTVNADTVMINNKAMERKKQLFRFAQYKSHA